MDATHWFGQVDWVHDGGVMLVVGLSTATFADLRITTESDDERTELLIKDGRIVSWVDKSNWVMVNCAMDEVTFVSQGRYWTGPIGELKATLEAQIAELSQPTDDTPGANFLGALFGGNKQSDKTEVRVSRVGEETVAGYPATQYRVETRKGSTWSTHELVSVSRDLLREMEAEIGGCTRVMMDFSQQMAALVPLGDTVAVYNDPSYRALFDEGYPVKSVTRMTLFGIQLEAVSAVVEVSRERLSDDWFTVPSNFRKVDRLSDLF